MGCARILRLSANGETIVRMTGRRCLLASVLVVVCQAGCGGGNDGAKCVPGASVACACPTGQIGAQICTSEGTFAVCVCGAPVTDASAPDSMDNSAPGPLDVSAFGGSPEAEPEVPSAASDVQPDAGLTFSDAQPDAQPDGSLVVSDAQSDPQPEMAVAVPDAQPDAQADAPMSNATLIVDTSSVVLRSNAAHVDGGVISAPDGGGVESIELGSSGYATVLITNTGGTASGALAVVPVPGVSTSGCTGALAPGATCALTIVATPTVLGQFTSTISIWATPGATTPVLISVNGSVVPRPAKLVITPNTPQRLTFSPSAPTAPITFRLTNAGDLSTGPLEIALTGPDAADFTATPSAGCTSIASRDTSCSVVVAFGLPSTGKTTEAATLVATDSSPGGSGVSVDIIVSVSISELTSYTFPESAEPCTPTRDVSGGQSMALGEGAACIRTADEISEWSCSGTDDRTVKVNAVASRCGATLPDRLGSFYYFELSAGPHAWAAISWWCSTCAGSGAHPVPSCGRYPDWKPGTTVAPCSD
jgi:hypothetical protein